MKKLWYKLLGYREIDYIVGEREETSFVGDKEFLMCTYSNYTILIKDKLGKFKVITSGVRPKEHVLYSELSRIVNDLSLSSKTDRRSTIRDYFIAKDMMTSFEDSIADFFAPQKGGTSFPIKRKISILKRPLDNYKDTLSYIIQDDKLLIQTMEEYKVKTLLPNEDIDIWEDYGNVIVTSDGCYFTLYDDQFSIDEEGNLRPEE